MSSGVVDIIREYVLQTLAQQGTIPYRITRRQYNAATDAIVQCLESASKNRDASPRVIQRETTMLALQAIPRAIAEVSTQLDSGPASPPPGPPGSGPAEDETPIDELVQKELSRRREQDAAIGVTPPTQSTPTPTEIIVPPQQLPDEPTMIPLTQPDTTGVLPQTEISSRPIPLPSPPLPSPPPPTQQANHPATSNTPSHTIAIPHNPDEASPLRIRYTPKQTQRTTHIDRVVMPVWVRGEDVPFIVCSVDGTDVYLFPSSSDPRILLPRPHQLPKQTSPGERVFTFRTPDGELLGTDFGRTTQHIKTDTNRIYSVGLSGESILRSLSGVRVKFKGNEEYSKRVYSIPTAPTPIAVNIPIPENESPVESALGNLRSPWAVSVFITYQMDIL